MAQRYDEDAKRFDKFLERVSEAVGHVDRREPLRAYVTGLFLPGERKSVEPMAAKIDPCRLRARHQSMHHFVSTAPWNDAAVIKTARDYSLEQFERHGGVHAWVIDDTGMPKKGVHSVGVARQYCGVLGKKENCQVTVSVSLANEALSVPAAYRLYLPDAWANNAKRRKVAGVPKEVKFKTKWQIAVEQVEQLLNDGVIPAPIVADAGYGDTTEFRDSLSALHLPYAVGIKPETSVWPPGQQPLPAAPRKKSGRPATRLRRTSDHRPVAVRKLALSLPKKAWKRVRWREGTRGVMSSRFAAIRVRPAHADDRGRTEPRDIEWLLIEWPSDEEEPTRYWLSTFPEKTALAELVRIPNRRLSQPQAEVGA